MKKGFALIELVIIVAIIGILASIFIPIIYDHTPKGKIEKYKREQTEAQQKREEHKEKIYKLSSGDFVHCKSYNNQNGLSNLSDCSDGHSYMSQTNVVILE